MLPFKYYQNLVIQDLTDGQRADLLEKARKKQWTVATLRRERDAVLGRLNLPFSVDRISFANRQAATAFAQRQQFGRRNQEANWLAYQRGSRHVEEKQDAHARPDNQNAKRGDNEAQKDCPPVKTAEVIAKDKFVPKPI